MGKATREITLVRAICTSTAYPSQWNAWDANNRFYYLRYRGGYGYINSAASQKVWGDRFTTMQWDEEAKVWRGDDPVTLEATFEHGHPLNGYITLPEFATLAGINLHPRLLTPEYWAHVRDQMVGEFAKKLRQVTSGEAPLDIFDE